jgi:uncharacterized RDD family membrane protein YckC
MNLKTTLTPAQTESKPSRHFHAPESERLRELEGLPLATFGQRLLGYAVDLVLAILLWAPAEACWRIFLMHEHDVRLSWDFHEIGNIVVLVLYYGLANYFGNGQTPGKWAARTRAVSLTHPRMGMWQSIERSLGYGAAVLEGGLGFLQYFWSENRMCAQDRLAETIVIDVRKPKS